MDVLGNRGKCAQPCRLPYELLDSSNKTIDKGHLLSPRDLCGIEYLPQLVQAGIKCLKIEGRLKSPEYVAITTRIYRKYLDLAINKGHSGVNGSSETPTPTGYSHKRCPCRA